MYNWIYLKVFENVEDKWLIRNFDRSYALLLHYDSLLRFDIWKIIFTYRFIFAQIVCENFILTTSNDEVFFVSLLKWLKFSAIMP